MSEKKVKLYITITSYKNYGNLFYLENLHHALAQYADRVEAQIVIWARNEMSLNCERSVHHFLESGADWYCLLTNDMQVPPNFLSFLLTHQNQKLIQGWTVSSAPPYVPQIYTYTRNPWHLQWQYAGIPYLCQDDYIPKDKVSTRLFGATGGMFVHRSAFNTIDPPWFKYDYNAITDKEKCGEDVWFVRQFIESDLPHIFCFDYVIQHEMNMLFPAGLQQLRKWYAPVMTGFEENVRKQLIRDIFKIPDVILHATE